MFHLDLVRHARAVPTWESGGVDFDRPLTAAGYKSFQMLVRDVAAVDLRPGRILHSPKVRAVQTAQLLADGLGMTDDQLESVALLGDGYNVDDLRQLLLKTGEEHVAVVAHQPTLGWMVNELTGGQLVAFTPGTVVRLDFEVAWRKSTIGRVWECF